MFGVCCPLYSTNAGWQEATVGTVPDEVVSCLLHTDYYLLQYRLMSNRKPTVTCNCQQYKSPFPIRLVIIFSVRTSRRHPGTIGARRCPGVLAPGVSRASAITPTPIRLLLCTRAQPESWRNLGTRLHGVFFNTRACPGDSRFLSESRNEREGIRTAIRTP